MPYINYIKNTKKVKDFFRVFTKYDIKKARVFAACGGKTRAFLLLQYIFQLLQCKINFILSNNQWRDKPDHILA